jgi:hypothetical protein
MASKLSPFMTVLLSLALITLAGALLAPVVAVEPFGAQGGEMVQLASSRVPTQEDAREWEREQRQVKKEIVDMTGYW